MKMVDIDDICCLIIDVGLDPDGEVPIGSVGDDGLNLN